MYNGECHGLVVFTQACSSGGLWALVSKPKHLVHLLQWGYCRPRWLIMLCTAFIHHNVVSIQRLLSVISLYWPERMQCIPTLHSGELWVLPNLCLLGNFSILDKSYPCLLQRRIFAYDVTNAIHTLKANRCHQIEKKICISHVMSWFLKCNIKRQAWLRLKHLKEAAKS